MSYSPQASMPGLAATLSQPATTLDQQTLFQRLLAMLGGGSSLNQQSGQLFQAGAPRYLPSQMPTRPGMGGGQPFQPPSTLSALNAFDQLVRGAGGQGGMNTGGPLGQLAGAGQGPTAQPSGFGGNQFGQQGIDPQTAAIQRLMQGNQGY